METAMRSLLSDNSRYLESFHFFLKNSTEHQCMQQFIETRLPDVISSIGDGKTTINVLGVGSGSGEIDLKIFSKIQARYPGVPIHTDIVEPSPEQILSYKERVAKTPGLENVHFNWINKTSFDFELQVKEEKSERKYDFIHMIQMLYYVEDLPATLTFFKSLLTPNGKLLIILGSGNSGFSILWKKYGPRLPRNDHCLYISADDIADMLKSEGTKYQSYELPSYRNITECFIDGNRNGDLMLDFLTETYDFNKNASPELREEIIQDLKCPKYSSVKEGKIILNSNLSAIVVGSG
ncbi:histamine N-methyltransferase B-like [Bufo bufo]|uniref:histamine N-methyltransferase B-like n=1 Tax=Bufo bufo TaxID=8384 RepID=UPI001ABE16F1|nr:histamine N-methyltransferase B-like [Bufo bufo]XP_040296382.1 histamine N-methyltransferase B-like [Bufo bufo]